LLRVPADTYGEEYRDHLLEQYKLYVDMADRVSSRRATANSFFLTGNAVLLAAFGSIYRGDTPTTVRTDWALVIPMCGIALCAVWCLLIRSYRQLNTGKWQIVHEMEKLLPVAPYDAEWAALGSGRDWRKYLQLTTVEQIATSGFLVFHAALAVLIIVL